MSQSIVILALLFVWLYDNEYASIIDIYFYEYFHLALALQNILDTLSAIFS
jgi:hypothetical protein